MNNYRFALADSSRQTVSQCKLFSDMQIKSRKKAIVELLFPPNEVSHLDNLPTTFLHDGIRTQ